jgi:hypothetical protein
MSIFLLTGMYCGHNSHPIIDETQEVIDKASNLIFLEDCGGDEILQNLEMEDVLEKLKDLDTDDQKKKTIDDESIFNPGRYELMEKLVHSDAVTHVVFLEQRMKNERKITIKNREIS